MQTERDIEARELLEERNDAEQRFQSLQAAVRAEVERLRKHAIALRSNDHEPDVIPAALFQEADRLEALLQEETG